MNTFDPTNPVLQDFLDSRAPQSGLKVSYFEYFAQLDLGEGEECYAGPSAS